MSDHETRKAAADKFCGAVSERVNQLTTPATPEQRARAWHDGAMLAAADDYCDAYFGYVAAGGEAARDRFRAAAEKWLEAWRLALRPSSARHDAALGRSEAA